MCVCVSVCDLHPPTHTHKAEIVEEEFEISSLIEEMKADKKAVEKYFDKVPLDIKEHIMSEEFIELTVEKFNEVDSDGNGVLSPDELYPVIEDLVSCPWSITLEHCKRFLEVFDENGDGVINLAEFHSFLAATVLISYLEYQAQQEAEDAEVAEEEFESKIELGVDSDPDAASKQVWVCVCVRASLYVCARTCMCACVSVCSYVFMMSVPCPPKIQFDPVH